jgi:hypothetical protein
MTELVSICVIVCACVHACERVALGMQLVQHMRVIILKSVACQTLQYFSTLSSKCHNYTHHRT